MEHYHTFSYHGPNGPVKITLARRTNRHALQTDRMRLALGEKADDGTDASYKRLFCESVVQTVRIEGELGLQFPSPSDAPDAIRAGYEAFMAGDGGLGDAYFIALARVNAPFGSREYQPAEQLSEDERKNSASGASPGAASAASSSGSSPASEPPA